MMLSENGKKQTQDRNVNVPQLRFAGFNDEWEKNKAGEIFKSVSDKGHAELPVLSASQQLGMIRRDKSGIDIKYNEKSIKNYKRVKPGQFVIHLRSFQGGFAWSDIEGITSPAYTVIDFKDSQNHISNFWKQVMTSSVFVKRLETVTYGIRDGRSISFSDFSMLNFVFPSGEEQKQIGKFFNKIDYLINLYQSKINLLIEKKKAYLQKVFPRKDKNVPVLRFSGFTNAWEQRKFSDLLDSSDGIRRGPFGSALKKDFFVPESNYVVYEQQNAIYNKYTTRYNISENKFNELRRFKVIPGDFIMSGAGTIGRISRVPKGVKKGVFNQALIRIKINPIVTDPQFFLHWIRSEHMQRKLTQSNPGSAMINLVPISEIKKWEVTVPKKEEQIKLGIFLEHLNHLITLHQRKLDVLKERKKAYLQKMFV